MVELWAFDQPKLGVRVKNRVVRALCMLDLKINGGFMFHILFVCMCVSVCACVCVIPSDNWKLFKDGYIFRWGKRYSTVFQVKYA